MRFAYHVLCEACVEATGHCAKCNKSDEVVNKPQAPASEAARLEEEYKKELKTLPERKRRTLIRTLKSQEKTLEGGEDQSSEASLTKIRGEALEKLKELKDNLGLEDDFDDLDFEFSSNESDEEK